MSKGPSQTLEAHRRAARQLKKAYAAREPGALTRVFAYVSQDKDLKHADFLFVVAREAGHESWPKLKFALEAAAMTRQEQAEELKRALYFGQHWRTERLLLEDASLAAENLGLQIALYDFEAVDAALAANPQAATMPDGNRFPLAILCFSQEIHRSAEKRQAMLSIARLLVDKGADIDLGIPAEPGSEHKLSMVYGALCHANNYDLGAWLLSEGANPNDNESLYHSTELGHTRALELLLRHGAKPDGTNALPRAIDFDNIEMVRILLEHGADPNLVTPDHPSGEPVNTISALHQAARRGASTPTVRLLLDHGADASALWDGHTPYAMARIYGNQPVADVLAQFGFASELDYNEAILARCAAGLQTGERLKVSQLSDEDKGLLTRLAFQPGKLEHMKALIDAGLDPETVDEMGLPPLHVAGWNGLYKEVAFFLSLGFDLTYQNNFGGDALDTVVHGSEFSPKRADSDHILCAKLLLEAGSVLHPDFISGCGNEDMAAFLQSWSPE